jgi:hypothetical protein
VVIRRRLGLDQQVRHLDVRPSREDDEGGSRHVVGVVDDGSARVQQRGAAGAVDEIAIVGGVVESDRPAVGARSDTDVVTAGIRHTSGLHNRGVDRSTGPIGSCERRAQTTARIVCGIVVDVKRRAGEGRLGRIQPTIRPRIAAASACRTFTSAYTAGSAPT